jgi:hypothetical protein
MKHEHLGLNPFAPASKVAEQVVQPIVNTAPRFAKTYCSQCGGEFGPGDSGYSHCRDHGTPRRHEDDWLMEFAKLLGKQSRERHEMRRKLRPAPVSDDDFDNAISREEMGERYL